MSQFDIQEQQTTTYLVNGKVYNTIEEAEQAKAGLANLALGMEFAEAQHPDLAERGQRTKANCIAEYLDWVAAGKPVKEASESSESNEDEE